MTDFTRNQQIWRAEIERLKADWGIAVQSQLAPFPAGSLDTIAAEVTAGYYPERVLSTARKLIPELRRKPDIDALTIVVRALACREEIIERGGKVSV